jgi:bifunctional non-homologous end joining protein LigD
VNLEQNLASAFWVKIMSLQEYRTKRNFGRTPEPKSNGNGATGNLFVVQKHDATRLHYDFRLEINGALASWAVPKGPSLNPAEKRLAVQVEDHPLDYANFEGVIPAGEYGGGPVMVWDQGRWLPQGDPAKGIRDGKLKFQLEGQKLHGAWTLVRMANGRRRGGRPNWLLIKERDVAARANGESEIVERMPKSVLTDRTIEEIAARKPAKQGRRKKGARKKSRASKQLPSDGELGSLAKSAGAKKRPFPRTLAAQLATAVTDPPEGNEWLHELKLDGYRMFCRVRAGKVKFISRNHHDWTARLKPLVEPASLLRVKDALLDGEVVILDEHGISSFQLLQKAFRGESRRPFIYYVFDLLHWNGYDIASLPLETRKALLEKLIAASFEATASIRFSEHLIGPGAEFRKQACKMQLEGIVSKRRDTPYTPGRGYDWVKSKCRLEQEVVIGGFTKPAGSRVGFGSLLVGHYRNDGKLAYAGRVGTGFSARLLRQLTARLKQLQQQRSPFVNLPYGVSTRGVTWVKPTLVAQVQFNNWTDDNLLRQAAFLGLREDKAAREVRREIPSKPPKPSPKRRNESS